MDPDSHMAHGWGEFFFHIFYYKCSISFIKMFNKSLNNFFFPLHDFFQDGHAEADIISFY